MIHLVLPSTLSFISPNFLLLKNRMTPRKRKMGLKTGASVLIVQQMILPTLLCSFSPARYKDDCNPAQAGSPRDTCLAKRHHRQRCCYHCIGWWLGVESHRHLCQLCESKPFYCCSLGSCLHRHTVKASLPSSRRCSEWALGLMSQALAISLTPLPVHINFFLSFFFFFFSFFFFCITRLWKNSLKPRTVQKLCVLGLEEALIPARLLKSHSNSMPLSTGEHESNQIKPHVWDHFHSHPPHIPCGSIALTLWSYMNVTPSMQIKACTSYCKNDKLRKVYQKWEVNYLLVYEVLHNILGL